MTPVRSLILTSGMAEARVIMDAAGNAKLCQGLVKAGGACELATMPVAAAILAVATGTRRAARPTQGIYLGVA